MPVIEVIDKDALKTRLDEGDDVQLVNVVSPDQYDRGTIRHSRKIPAEEVDRRVSELDPHKEVVVYSTGPECPAASKAAWKLMMRQFRVCVFKGGIQEWRSAGLPLE